MTTREQAIEWWNKQTSELKQELFEEYAGRMFTPAITYHHITGREVENIWKATVNAPVPTDQWKKALISLTPGGSEFVDDPGRCVEFIKDLQQRQHDMIVELTKRNKSLV